MFTQGYVNLVLFVVPPFFGAANFLVVLIGESVHGGLPQLFSGLVVVLEVLVLEEAAQIHLPDEENSFFHARDNNLKVGALEVPLVDMRCEYHDVCIGGVGPGGVKVRLHLELLRVGDGKPRSQLSENLEDHAFVVSHVFFVEGLDVLLVDICGNRLNAHQVNELLVDAVRPHSQLLILGV